MMYVEVNDGAILAILAGGEAGLIVLLPRAIADKT
jgi:hypothetical protein